MNAIISKAMRDVLIEHIDCRFVPLVRAHRGDKIKTARLTGRYTVILSLIRRRFLIWDRPAMPRATKITELGREALAEELADWAAAIALRDSKLEGLIARPVGAVDRESEDVA